MARRLLLPLLVVAVALGSIGHAARPAALAWPAVKEETKPWSRWWWLGNIGDAKSYTWEMEQYAASGLGGLEITPIYGVRGYENRFVPFLSSNWVSNFRHVLAEGKRLGLGVDLATGTGWPFGGPWLSKNDVAHYLAHRSFKVPAGERLREAVEFRDPGFLRLAGPRRVKLGELKSPVTANANLQDLAIDQVRFPESQPLAALMAYPEKGDAVDLTSKVGPDGTLDWTAPTDAGEWTLYALFRGEHGKLVERAAPGGEGLAMDHLSAEALSHYLAKFDAAFEGGAANGLRAFFNDSYEVDDAHGESDFTPRFFEEFQKRRGYDLRQHLPDFFAANTTAARSRVVSDYRETVSDLLLEQFTIPWREWSHRHGAVIRNQAHGSPANILDLYAASDIPEQENADIIANKLASSAAHVLGKPLTSAETGTWLNEHFLGTLGELKARVDSLLLSGINHNCYHGTVSSPQNDPWPGFQFYAAVELSPANPIWADFPALNAYVTRAQSFLQSGRPDEDVLLYYNIHDRWADVGDGTMPHFHGGARDGVGAHEVGAALREAGFGFDFVSDRLLRGVAVEDGILKTAGSQYRAIMVPPTKFMPEATLRHLVGLAENGATVFVLDHLPEDAPGLHPQDGRYAALLAKLRANASTLGSVTTYTVGSGKVMVGENVAALLSRQKDVAPETMGQFGLEFVRRRSDAGHFYFITNRSEATIDGWIPLQSAGKSAALFNPADGALGRAAFRPAAAGGSEAYLQIAPGESRIVQIFEDELAGAAWSYWLSAGSARPLKGQWEVTFLKGGPALPAVAKADAPGSWTRFSDETVKNFAGTAAYALSFSRPDDQAAAWQLDLGNVADSARVVLNGKEIAALIGSPWRVVIPASELRDENRLEVLVTNVAANRIADMDRRGIPWKKFYNTNMPARVGANTGPDRLFSAAKWNVRDAGLLGPVTLMPVRVSNPQPSTSPKS